MVKTLQEYITETSQSYEPTRQYLQSQIDSQGAKKQSDIEAYGHQYNKSLNDINDQIADAAYSDSIRAAGNGGSFGGAAAIAAEKRNQQQFVPAITQVNNNKNSYLSNLDKTYQNTYDNLAQQLASLQSQANTYATQRYDEAVAAEEATRQFNEQLAEQKRQADLDNAYRQQQLAEQKRQADAQLAAQNAYNNYLMQAMKQPTYKNWDFGNGYSVTSDANGNAIYSLNGNRISAGSFLQGTTGRSGQNWDKWNDMWANGVSTQGIGSDTIDSFNNAVHSGNSISNTYKQLLNNYGYLY